MPAVVPVISETTWTDGWATQHAVPVTYGGTPYLSPPTKPSGLAPASSSSAT